MGRITPEGRVKNAIKKELKQTHPHAFSFIPVSNGMGRHGIPDFICCVPITITPELVGESLGIFLGIEAKTRDGKLSEKQSLCLKEIAAARGSAMIVWGSDDVAQISNVIEHIGYVPYQNDWMERQ